MALMNIPAPPQIGIVTSVDTALYKVKVLYPLLRLDSDWIRVTTCYVGQGWGLSALPHTGNEVVVQFMNGDLNDGIVTGVLFSDNSDLPPASQGEITLQHESGTILNLSSNGTIQLMGGGPAIARVGDSVSCPCGTGTILSGSSKATCG